MRYRHPRQEVTDKEYTTPEEVIIQRKQLQDLRITISDNVTLDCHTDDIVVKGRQNMGWMLRNTFVDIVI